MFKRPCMTVTCECCGKAFKQARYWQVYCSKACKQTMLRASVSELRKLRLALVDARNRIKDLESMLQDQA